MAEKILTEEEKQAAAAAKVAEAERKAAEKAAKKGPEDRVTVRLFKDNGKYKDDVFVAVNGRSFQIQRGVDVQVPRYVAQVLQDSMDQDQRTAELMEREAGYFAEESRKVGL